MSNGMQGGAPGIMTRSYKSGSIVYMEGDKSDNIYVLKSGRVILTTKKVEDRIWVEVKENVKPGEFFGVKSALGRYPRDETAQTFGDTLVLVLSLADFERLVLKNLNVVKKMLQVFSNQLRRIGKTVREVLGQTEALNPDIELFKIGEYYYKAGRTNQAQHAFKKYIEFYPDSKQAAVARQRIQAIQSGGGGGDADDIFAAAPADEEPIPASSGSGVDMTDFSLDDSGSGGESSDFLGEGEDEVKPAPARSPLAGEMDEFLMEDTAAPVDDFSLDEPEPAAPRPSPQDINEIFYEAMRLFSEESYDEAIELYGKILEFKTLKNEAERKTFEKAHFELGRCFHKKRNYKEALNSFSAMIKKFPNTEFMKNAYLYIGMVFEETKNFDKAAGYYQRVASMEPRDQINKDAANRLARIQRNQGK